MGLSRSLKVRRRLRDGGSVFARVGCAIIYALGGIVYDHLAAAHDAGEVAEQLEVVALCSERLTDVRGDAALDREIAAAPGYLGEAGSLKRHLNIHAVV